MAGNISVEYDILNMLKIFFCRSLGEFASHCNTDSREPSATKL